MRIAVESCVLVDACWLLLTSVTLQFDGLHTGIPANTHAGRQLLGGVAGVMLVGCCAPLGLGRASLCRQRVGPCLDLHGWYDYQQGY